MSDIVNLTNQIKDINFRNGNFYLWAMKVSALYKLYNELKDYKNADYWAEYLIHNCTKNYLKNMTAQEQKSIVNEIRQTYFYLGRRGYFHYFLIGMEFDRPYKERFYQPRMRTLKVVVDDLQDFYDGKINVYILMMPPRTGKTTLGLLFMSMLMGLKPEKTSIAVSYGGFVASSFYDGVYEFITDKRYNYQDIFPQAPVADKDAKNLTLDLGIPKRYKTATFRSIDGQLTGALEATELMYFDDLISGIEEANNQDRLKKAWDKVTVDLLQRMKPEQGCRLLVIGTNWAKNDPIGLLSDMYANSPQARTRKIPALDYVTDESNFVYDNNVGFSSQYYKNMRDVKLKHDPVAFACVYQQLQMEDTNEIMIKKELLNYYNELPDGVEADNTLAFVDVAFGGGDFLSMPVAKIYGNDIYIDDWLLDGHHYKITEPRVVDFIIKNNIKRIVFESNNGGEFYANDIKRILKERNYNCIIESRRTPNNITKMARIQNYLPDIYSLYYKNPEKLTNVSDYYRAFTYLTGYRKTEAKQIDDPPDSLAGLCSMTKGNYKQRVTATCIPRSSVPYL